MSESVLIFLVDNGSVFRPSIDNLLHVASLLENAIGRKVIGVSCGFSDSVGGKLLAQELDKLLHESINGDSEQLIGLRIIVVPFCISPGAVVQKMKRQLVSRGIYSPGPLIENSSSNSSDRIKQKGISVVGRALYEEGSLDLRIAEIAFERIEELIQREKIKNAIVIVVDHGSPQLQMARIRNCISGQISMLLAKCWKLDEDLKPTSCYAASMERREGKEYQFGDPLLENLLVVEPFRSSNVIISMLFLSPGRHAGENGDIQQICEQAKNQNSSSFNYYLTDLLGTHSKVIDILKDNYLEAQQQLLQLGT